MLAHAAPRYGLRSRNISMQEGLRSNTVRNIVQDAVGFVWMGTDNGLSRYDGYEVRTYRNAAQGSDQYVSTLMVDGNRLLLGTSRGLYAFDTRTERFAPFLAHYVTTQPTSMARDRDGNLWVSTMGQGVWRYDARGRRLRHFVFRAQGGRVAQVMVDADNQVWALSNSGGAALCRLDKARDTFRPVEVGAGVGSHGGLRMAQGRDGTLWVGTWTNGLMRMGRDGRMTQAIEPAACPMVRHIHTLVERSADCLLLGCDDGILHYNPQTGEWQKVVLEEAGEYPLSDKFVYSIFCDKEGGVWFGTFYSGANYLSAAANRFMGYGHGVRGYRGNVVSRFCEDDRGRVWIGSDDGGLACYDPRTRRMEPYAGQTVLSGYNVHGLCADGMRLWVGTYSNGIVRLDMASGAMRTYGAADGLDGHSCYAIARDSCGRLWVGTMEGVGRYEPAVDRFVRMRRAGAVVVDIDEDRRGHLWFATQGGGLLRHTPATGAWRAYRSDGRRGGLPSDEVNAVLVDGGGRLWVGTQGGLCRYDERADAFEPVALGLPWAVQVQGMVDRGDELWLATTHGIVRYAPGAPLRLYNQYDGLMSEQFQPSAAMKGADGRLYFGSVKGFVAFYPHEVELNAMEPRVVLTALEIFNKPQEVGAAVLPEALHRMGRIELSHSENMFSLVFSALSFSAPGKNRYRYMLEGLDKEWMEAGEQHRATYTNVPPGDYVFRVRATNNDGVWGAREARLRIVVHPPFWWSLPAKVAYGVLLLLLVYAYTQARLRRAERRHADEMRSLNERKELEVREARLRFFTMIAHEIRTPVSLIIGPLEQLMERKGPRGDGELGVIHRNAHRLLELVNQLLDFNKVQQQGLEVHFRLHDIRRLMEAVAVRFGPTMAQRGIGFEVAYPPEGFCAVVDEEGLTKIISNLMTNAVKYTRDWVRLSCEVDARADRFRIAVEDNGVGIGRKEREKIFRPFYQARDNKPGTGIGLSIVKTLVELHEGTIAVESEEGRGARFVVELSVSGLTPQAAPGGETAEPVAWAAPAASVAMGSGEPAGEMAPEQAVLIVEDDDDMLRFVATHFRRDYRVYTAANGVEALEELRRHAVSLIVSDWMMPGMDGAELCRRVRADRDTSHVPFVMLTAKTDDDSKAEGMECGADAYIEKPFSMKYLEACIRNLIDRRRQLMQHFAHTPTEPIAQMATSAVDDDFLTRMNALIEANLDNPALNVAFLAERMGISRSGLFAKLKSLADATPNEMIQVIRLRHAALLLREGRYRVNEVCFMVGFGSASYFSKCFQKQFGVKPGEYKG